MSFNLPELFSFAKADPPSPLIATMELSKTMTKSEWLEASETSFTRPYERFVNMGYITNIRCPFMKDEGCFFVMVNATFAGGPNGVFTMCRSDPLNTGGVHTLSSSAGINGDSVCVMWNRREYPHVVWKHALKNMPANPDTPLHFGFRVRVL